MSKEIQNLEPKAVWGKFYEITQIPRPSKHEEKIREYLIDFAKKNNIECIVDKIGNVMYRKPATPGMENRKGLVLQAHMDMVPQKNGDKVFDFENDPIDAYVDGEWVTADGTTLGADNGMGLAAILAAFEDNDLKHGLLEALITVDEETGMTGAFALEAGVLKGDILLNLDSETHGELYVGCAGGLDLNLTLDYTEEAAPAGMAAYTLALKGLKGGHSGMEIILQRGNANKLMVRFLKYATKELGLRISAIDGGGLRNAIPRESVATVLVPAENAAKFEAAVAEYEQLYLSELALVDEGLTFKAEKAEMPATVVDAETQMKALNMVYGAFNGVYRMSDSMKGLVETSVNLAHFWIEDKQFKLIGLLRSSVNSQKYDLAEMLSSVFDLAGAKYVYTGGYDGWKPNMESPILKTILASYEGLYGVRPEIMAIHAGLECGILGGQYPHWDMISFGPTMCFPHSPDEKVNIESVGKFWNFLRHTIENAPEK